MYVVYYADIGKHISEAAVADIVSPPTGSTHSLAIAALGSKDKSFV